jgi:hypothetical protein
MVNKEAPSDGGAGMYLDPGEQSRDIGKNPGQPFELHAPQPVTQAMQQHGVQTRVGRQYLEGSACGRIAFKDALDVFFDSFEHSV